jgi:hypothetical protein
MKLFRRKSTSNARRLALRDGNNRTAAIPTRRLTLGLSRAETLAAMLARSRASDTIEIADVLAGMYISDWERLSQYWQPADHERVEGFLRHICGISPQRWHSWIEFYDHERHGDTDRSKLLPFFRRKAKLIAARHNRPLRHSTSLEGIFKEAEKVAPYRDRTPSRSIPILTSECLLLCIARNTTSEVSRKLAATGLDMLMIEKEALSPRRARRD